MANWAPLCALCELLNSYRDSRPATTTYQGIAVCREHLNEIANGEHTAAARKVRELLANSR